jgi:beta-N-acetylhexosaminidase
MLAGLLGLLVAGVTLGLAIAGSGRHADGHTRAFGRSAAAHHRAARAPAQHRTTSPEGPARALGELIVSRYTGAVPTRSFLRRVGSGEIGGVILFAENAVAGTAVVRRAIDRLQKAARRGGTYPLLIMTDQEGGEVKRFPSIPPWRAAQEMETASLAWGEGYATGRGLRLIGVNVDLAPVADVERTPGSFLGTRSFGSSASAVADRACAFAAGLNAGGVAFTLKHFPGLGRAPASTDVGPVTVESSASRLRDDYGAYMRCGRSGVGLVMVSSAIYPALTRTQIPAVLSSEIYSRELASQGIGLPTISDDLDAPAISQLSAPGLRAIDAGLDLLLYARTERSSAIAYRALAHDLRTGSLSPVRVLAAAAAIRAVKARLGR